MQYLTCYTGRFTWCWATSIGWLPRSRTYYLAFTILHLSLCDSRNLTIHNSDRSALLPSYPSPTFYMWPFHTFQIAKKRVIIVMSIYSLRRRRISGKYSNSTLIFWWSLIRNWEKRTLIALRGNSLMINLLMKVKYISANNW